MQSPIIRLICLLLILPGCLLFNASQKSSENSQQTDKPLSANDPESTDLIQEQKNLNPTSEETEALEETRKEQKTRGDMGGLLDEYELLNPTSEEREALEKTRKEQETRDDMGSLYHEHEKLKPTGAEAEALAKAIEGQKSDKSEGMELYRSFIKLLPTNPKAAENKLAEHAEIQYGAHPNVNKWVNLFFRLARDGTGPLSDHILLLELEVQMLTDIDSEKYSMQVKNLKRVLKQYAVMTKMAEREGKTPETYEMEFRLELP